MILLVKLQTLMGLKSKKDDGFLLFGMRTWEALEMASGNSNPSKKVLVALIRSLPRIF